MKKIVLANTTYRFYRKDNWNRAEVAALLPSGDIKYVIPRWFDKDKDSKIKSSLLVLNDNIDYSDCDYYAIYHLGKEAELDIKELSKLYTIT